MTDDALASSRRRQVALTLTASLLRRLLVTFIFRARHIGSRACRAHAAPRCLQIIDLAGPPDHLDVLIEDGTGKRPGQSFGVTLWPTLVVRRYGAEVAQGSGRRARRAWLERLHGQYSP